MGNLAAGLDDRIGALEAELEHLAADRQHYADFFALAPEPCFVTDAAGAILDANHAAARLLGGEGELRGRPIDWLVPMEQRRMFRASLASVAAGCGQVRFPGKLRRRDGDLAVEFSVSAVQRARSALRLLWVVRPLG